MADYSNYTNGAKSRFGFGFKHWQTSNDTRPDLWANSDLFTRPSPHRDHVCRPVIIGSDGRSRPAVFECPPKHHHKQTTTNIEENAYRIQPASPRAKDYVMDECKMGFSGGMFQRSKPNYDMPEPTLITEGGWARPSPNGWKLPPEASLEKVTNNIDTATTYSRRAAWPTSGIEWAGSGLNVMRGRVGPTSTTSAGQWGSTGMYSDFGEKKTTATIDSRAAVKKYGGKFTW